MRTLCEHIFDLVQNSIHAKAYNIHVSVEEDTGQNLFKIKINDDGRGIKPEILDNVKETFFSTRPKSVRKAGLGLALMDAACTRAGGELIVESVYGKGTDITATMTHDNIDRTPLGDIADLFSSLLMSSLENRIIWTLRHEYNGSSYRLRNRATAEELDIDSYGEPAVRLKLYKHIKAKEAGIHG
jgi:hypothetical protein